MAHPAFDRSTYDPPPGAWPLVEVDTTDADPARLVTELRAILTEPAPRARSGRAT
jgi:hypothetical protein